MPTPDRTSLAAIVAAGTHLLETDGLDAVTMTAVAHRVGVRAPSLYKRVRNRDELIRLIAEAAVAELGNVLADADPGSGEPRERLIAIVTALRDFARARTAAYQLVFMPLTSEEQPSRELLQTSSAPLFDAVTEIVDHGHVLEAARTFTAWATGFIAMELNGSFHLGGNVDAAFDYGVERLTAAITDR